MPIGSCRCAFMASLLALAACDQDPFHRSEQRFPESSYRLKKWEDEQTFYLVGRLFPDTGVVHSSVVQIGWRDHYILFRHTGDGPKHDGWFVLDTRADTLSGPYTDAGLRELAAVATVPTIGPAQAWDSLGKL